MWMKQEEKLRKGRAARPFQFGKLEVVWRLERLAYEFLFTWLAWNFQSERQIFVIKSNRKAMNAMYNWCVFRRKAAKFLSSCFRSGYGGEEKSQSINVGSNDLVRTKAANSKSALTQKLLVEIWKHLRVKCRYVTTQKSDSGMEFIRFKFVFDWNCSLNELKCN